MTRFAALALLGIWSACDSDDGKSAAPQEEAPTVAADVIQVEVRGTPGAYTFAVTVASPDSGCSQYADWWEVVSAHGELLYRRVLLHSHVSEQPFLRSGGPVDITADDTVWVRAHMNVGEGYGGVALVGTADEGFTVASPVTGFGADLATHEPLPTDCDF